MSKQVSSDKKTPLPARGAQVRLQATPAILAELKSKSPIQVTEYPHHDEQDFKK